jgi:hypothetical protein
MTDITQTSEQNKTGDCCLKMKPDDFLERANSFGNCRIAMVPHPDWPVIKEGMPDQ